MKVRLKAVERRYSGSRLTAALAMGLAAVGAMMTAIDLHPLEDGTPIRPYLSAAMLCGVIAGWSNMGRALGAGLWRAGLGGLSAGASGLVYFLLLAGMRQTYRVYSFSHFDTPAALFEHMIGQMIKVFWVAMEAPILAAMMIGAALAGVLAESVRRISD